MRRTLWRALALALLGSGAASTLWAQSAPARPVALDGAGPRATRDVARDEVLARTDIAGDSAAADSLVGWIARRRIRVGEPLRPPAIGRRALIAVGTGITVVATVEGVRASRSGTALSGGAMGQRIRVRLEGARIVVATVTGPAEAIVP